MPKQRSSQERLFTEQLISFEEAGTLVPNRVHYTTVYRWASKGILASDGKTRVKLESVRLGGGRRYTSPQALTRFLVAADEAHLA